VIFISKENEPGDIAYFQRTCFTIKKKVMLFSKNEFERHEVVVAIIDRRYLG